MSALQAELLSYLPFKRKQTSSGWTSFDAPCCVHNGESPDTRKRGGFINHGAQGFSYHCFNCGFKTSWQSGRTLSHKNKKFFTWLNVPDSKINEWSLEALKTLDNSGTDKTQFKEFVDKALPIDSMPLKDALLEFPESMACLEYILDRGHTLEDCDWQYCPLPGYQDRLIIPFYHMKKCVGYTARKVVKGTPKYLSESQTGYVFNMDRQNYNSKVVLVTEGPFDGLAVNGVSILTNIPNDQQVATINSLGKTVVVVPDRDYPGMSLVRCAMENGWLVAIPNWEDDVKDVSDAFKRYGRLFTMKTILDTATDNKVKLELLIKKYPKETTNA
jgi:hypothetical protein